ncbi:MAG: hypothetical protein Q8L34_03480 [Candidatus Woesearchaeota archaeon]|nr:hypothetical protein [Candidatus Woesearchaeota archaeon]
MKEEKSKPHFAKKIDYAKSRDESWRSDFLIGRGGSLYRRHGHLALSGAGVWYLRNENGKVIINNGVVVADDL